MPDNITPIKSRATQEEWRPVVGYEGRYEVSSFGKVRGLIAPNSRPRKTPKIVKACPHPDPPRAMICALTVKYKTRHFLVHRLVLLAFVGPAPEGCEGSHKDGNWRHNHLDNLCWETHTENEYRKRAHGTLRQGTQTKRAKMTEKMVQDARKRYRDGEPIRAIHRSLPVSYITTYLMLKGRTWKHVQT